MAKATSFIGEHSAEFALVPVLKKILHKQFEFVTPIFPWMTREGSNLSRDLHTNDNFKILGMYPRRPKFYLSGMNNIFCKISGDVINGAKSGFEIGIPIIAGLPLVSNFWDIGKKESECIWILLDSMPAEDHEFKIVKDADLNAFKKENNIGINFFLEEDEILSYVNKHARIQTLTTALEGFKHIKMKMKNSFALNSSYFMYLGGYKAVYFLLK